jgi:hypothetical protein
MCVCVIAEPGEMAAVFFAAVQTECCGEMNPTHGGGR